MQICPPKGTGKTVPLTYHTTALENLQQVLRISKLYKVRVLCNLRTILLDNACALHYKLKHLVEIGKNRIDTRPNLDLATCRHVIIVVHIAGLNWKPDLEVNPENFEPKLSVADFARRKN